MGSELEKIAQAFWPEAWERADCVERRRLLGVLSGGMQRLAKAGFVIAAVVSAGALRPEESSNG